MAKNEVKVEIGEQIAKYCEKKETEKALKKEISVLSGDIKEFLITGNKTEEEVGEWRVVLQHKVSETVDEEKLLYILKEYWKSIYKDETPCPFVTTVECINMDALESAIYKEEIPNEVLMQIDKCRIKKETEALTYSKAKKDKTDYSKEIFGEGEN